MRSSLAVLLVAGLAASPAVAATFNLSDAETAAPLGSFEAPEGGGPLTSAAFFFGGVTFDLFTSAANPPTFDAALGQITGLALPVARFTNSAEGLIDGFTCAVEACLLSFFPDTGPGIYDVVVNGEGEDGPLFEFTGAYVVAAAEPVAPIPLPASAPLLAGAFALLGLALRGRRRA